MPIEIKEMIIKTTVTSTSGGMEESKEKYQIDWEEMRQEVRKICLEVVKDFFQKKKLR